MNLALPNISVPLDEDDSCGRCGKPLIVQKNGKEWFSACGNRQCLDKWCKCTDEFKAGNITKLCLAHWKCDCRKGTLCEFHRIRPEMIVARAKKKGAHWAEDSGFQLLLNQATQWISIYSQQRQKAYNHCGSCWSTLKTKKNSSGEQQTFCPKGCKCYCSSSDKICFVHFGCSCPTYSLCEFHKTKRPDVAVALYEALPPNDRARIFLSKGFVQAGIDRFKYKKRGPKPKHITKLPPSAAPVSIQTPKSSEARGTNANTAQAETPKSKSKAATAKHLSQKPVDPAASANASSKSVRKQTAKKIRTYHLGQELESELPGYKKWLERQPLSSHSKRAYLSRIVSFIAFLNDSNEQYPALTPATKDLPVRDLRQHLKKKAKLKPATINSYLAAIDNFYGYLDLGKIKISRDELPQEAPVALERKEQDRFRRTIEHTKRVKDKAIATLLFYTGLRVSECTQLELDDVFVVGRKAKAIIRAGKGDKYREVPLNSAVCQAIREWLAERKDKYAGRAISKALFLNPQGKPLSSNSVYEIIRKLGEDCGLELSPHTLRHTCFTKLVRNKADLILVSDIAGHRSLNTTKRYALPSAADKAKALEDLID